MTPVEAPGVATVALLTMLGAGWIYSADLRAMPLAPLERLEQIHLNTRSSKAYSGALPANHLIELIPTQTAALAARLYSRTRLGDGPAFTVKFGWRVKTGLESRVGDDDLLPVDALFFR